MRILLIMRLLLLPLLIISSSGCGYHLTNKDLCNQRMNNSQKLWIPFFINETVSPTAQTVLRRAFYQELHALRGLSPANSESDAVIIMKARIISYSNSVVSYSAIDQAKQFTISLEVELEMAKKGDILPVWKGRIQGTKQYPANTDLALQRDSEEEALDAVARLIAHKLISALEESY